MALVKSLHVIKLKVDGMLYHWRKKNQIIDVELVVECETILEWNFLYHVNQKVAPGFKRWEAPGAEVGLLAFTNLNNDRRAVIHSLQPLKGPRGALSQISGVDATDYYYEELLPPSFSRHRKSFDGAWVALIKSTRKLSSEKWVRVTHFARFPRIDSFEDCNRALNNKGLTFSDFLPDEQRAGCSLTTKIQYSQVNLLRSIAEVFVHVTTAGGEYSGWELATIDLVD